MSVLKFLILGIVIGTVIASPSGGKDPLSDQQHYKDGQHNAEYDHEAFVGKEEAQKFHELTPEESRRRLGVIFDKIDKNRDGSASIEELRDWVSKVSKRYVYDDVDRLWDYFDLDHDGFVNLDEHQQTYGVIDNMDDIYDQRIGLTYRQKIARDKKRFEIADKTRDGKMNKEEYAPFIHPEAFREMRDLYVNEIFEDMDKNKDNFVSIKEYVDNRWPPSRREPGEEEPAWIDDDREQFRTHRDKDKDGRLNKEELGEWMVPTEYDPAMAETKHILYHSDSDKNDAISRGEMLDNMEFFVGSQVTEFGQSLNRHDEF